VRQYSVRIRPRGSEAQRLESQRRHTSECPPLLAVLFTFGEDKANADDILDEPPEASGPDEGVALGVKDFLVALETIDEDSIRVGKTEVADQWRFGPSPHPGSEGLLRVARRELVERLADDEVMILRRWRLVIVKRCFGYSHGFWISTFGPGNLRRGEMKYGYTRIR